MASPTSINPAHAHFESVLQAQLCQDVLSSFQGLCRALGLEPGGGLPQYHKIKAQLNYWSAKSLWAKLDKRASQPVYQQGRACTGTKCLVVGAGPCGLRAAVELAMLGARVVLVEKRTKFSRHNVLHLWPFTIHDLRALGAKKFYGRFCTGSLDHISIRQLQLLLLKVALLLGVEIHWGVTFTGLQPPPRKGSGWRAQLQPSPPAQLANYEFDVLISAAGGKFVPEGFTVREMRGKLAIGITANFVNGRTVEETQVPEISGVARIYNQSFFQSLLKATGIDLENIVYYKDDTHYFVMTAKKQCLLRLGVLRQDWPETDRLLGSANVAPEALQRFARAAADFATHGKLGKLEFAQDAHGRPDVSAFDFTSMMRAESSARVQEKHGARLLLGLVGDCLVEPFWPLGTGVARGFLAAFDAAWMVKRWAEGAGPLEVLAERESLYQLLSQTSPENMHRNVAQYGLDPASRYPNLNLRAVTPSQVRDLYDVEAKEPVQRMSDKTDSRKPATALVATQEELLHWCQEQTAGYPGVHVTDLSSSWVDGLALCALVHRLRPGLLEPSELQGVGALEATSWALKMAEHELGITPVLSAQAMVAGNDPLGLIAYLSHFHSAFKSTPHNPAGPVSQGSPGTASAVLFLGKLQRTLQRTRAQGNGEDAGGKKPRVEVEAETPSTEEPPVPEPDVPVTPPSQYQEASAEDLCALCGEHLYILERLCANGRFFHRSCFRCHICEATLWPSGYGQHPGDGHFYCLQHLPQPGHKEDSSDRGPESQDLPTHSENNMPSRPSIPGAPQEGTTPVPSQPTRQLIRLSSPERQRLSSLHLTPDPEMEAPPKPPRSCSVLARQALEGSFVGWGMPVQSPQVLVAVEKEEEESPCSSDEEAEEDVPLDSDTEQVLWNLAKNSGTMNSYPTWRRTLLRRAKEEEMKRFCKAQAIQRRQNEIEAALRELEAKGTELELALRSRSSSPEQQKALWLEQLLQLVQKKNSLVAEEAELMITVQELNLEEKQWQLDQELRTYMNREETLKTAADRQAEDQVLRKLVDVVNQRDALIRFQEERRLSELASGPGPQG
ncbi:F-actin-monooxygenase MICAL1 isoform X2 [Globicephala melas]|uniref:F-actin-monooxygenase MICAL1 isoform X2 n=1 Tax=Globicephala melas TaxID=9731 RepID=UPI00122EDCAE|nr:F-actin-monooxygenase MICAL1 isoform X3 [Globicephala melas]XP_060139464.1 F-actin-monooxygenase MICAL1 isoform X3 [Globicephala melas]XP_060139465.1 F-actin-monooxygenase MICAL1 isoform X3 [Globicephala melas]XP_060139466.1 F-actin-monooxygenase MICAL1 isoform X3 [Globicephala melas]XP_060139467.1 F-actin-monooxygenase MICAL1 isoform X3 [Globicephala melas]XP_060139468.1 F-actin-monooxygenase MICAL1 isoform X3 [Globicephala melas]XP_060139469.1 F-actin-monooxygenase MICAL1 isoform X3 [Glo